MATEAGISECNKNISMNNSNLIPGNYISDSISLVTIIKCFLSHCIEMCYMLYWSSEANKLPFKATISFNIIESSG